jgi:hypothetical protein
MKKTTLIGMLFAASTLLGASSASVACECSAHQQKAGATVESPQNPGAAKAEGCACQHGKDAGCKCESCQQAKGSCACESCQCEGCAHKKAAGAKSEQAKVKAGATYTCPMHPNVVHDKPGECPDCGMALVPTDSTKK